MDRSLAGHDYLSIGIRIATETPPDFRDGVGTIPQSIWFDIIITLLLSGAG
jgi:hypothetical protein